MRILIDTSCLSRFFDNGKIQIENILNKLLANGDDIVISDFTLYELSTQANVDFMSVPQIIRKYKMILTYEKNQEYVYENYYKFDNKQCDIKKFIEQLQKSFAKEFSTAVTDLIMAVILAFSKKLFDKSTPKANAFYSYISSFYVNSDGSKNEIVYKEIKNYLNEKILEALNSNPPKKIKGLLLEEFNDIIIRLVVYYRLNDYLLAETTNIEFMQKYESEYNKLKMQYDKKCYDEIIRTESNINIPLADLIEKEVGLEFERDFLLYQVEHIFQIGKFQMNDVVDSLNLKRSMEFCDCFLTFDDKFYNKAKKCFKNNNTINFIEQSEIMRNEYKKL